MTRILTSPVTRQAVIKTITGAIKLGALAASSALLNKTFRAATDFYLTRTLQHYRQIKFMVTEGEA